MRSTSKKKPAMVSTTTNRKGEEHHFFASSAVEWKVGTDIAALIAHMKRSDWGFNVFLVPGAVNRPYGIENYVPNVPDCVWLAFYGTEKGSDQNDR